MKGIKKKTWDMFSKYIRTRDCIKTTNNLYIGKCYTCERTFNFQNLQAGHFQPGRKNIFLFDERQVHAQCGQCNIYYKGNWPPYLENMIRDYGEKEVNIMLHSRKTVKQYKDFDYEDIYNKYKKMYMDLIRCKEEGGEN